MKALCMVAHPDDCVIFAYSFIHNHPGLEWTICYLTYTKDHPRGIELSKFWQGRGIDTKFLGYADDYRDLDTNCLSFDTVNAQQDIQNLCHKHDIILTHDASGDYGHIHHKFVNMSIPIDHGHVITFAPPGKGTDTYKIPSGVYSLNELPQHSSIIESFHRMIHTNSYNIPMSTKSMLDNQT